MAALMTTTPAPHPIDPASRPSAHRGAPHRSAPHRSAPHRSAPHRSAPHRSASRHRRSHLRLVSPPAARPGGGSAAPIGGRVRPPYLRRRLAVLLAASAVVVVVVGAAAPVLHADPIDPAAGARTHVVSQGDTVWSLATGLRPGSDPRPVVDEILELNADAGVAVDPGGLRVGQRVLLPGE
jgi:hypothetical protein